MYVHVCMYVWMYVWMYVCMNVCMYVYHSYQFFMSAHFKVKTKHHQTCQYWKLTEWTKGAVCQKEEKKIAKAKRYTDIICAAQSSVAWITQWLCHPRHNSVLGGFFVVSMQPVMFLNDISTYLTVHCLTYVESVNGDYSGPRVHRQQSRRNVHDDIDEHAVYMQGYNTYAR